MGMSVGTGGSAGGTRRRRRRSGAGAISEINVTPFVDVMLVLLIVFMVAAPLLTSGVPLDLPKTAAKSLNIDTKPITVSINGEGRLFLQEDEVTVEDLITKLSAIADARAGFDERIFVRGDSGAPYRNIAEVLGIINRAGYKKIGLVTLDENNG